MIFVAAGLLIGPIEVGASHGVGVFLEIALALVLFTDAISIELTTLRRELFLPGRLLGIGLPLTIIAGLAAALLIFDALDFWEAAVVAVVLAPTDAALGQAVVSNSKVPLLIRQGLSVESGLNDGLAVPLLSIFVVQGLISAGVEPAEELGRVFLEEIGIGLVVGLAVGWVGAKLLLYSSAKGWMGAVWRGTSVSALAVLSFLAAAELGGSGFISAFVAGLTFGAVVRKHYPKVAEHSEGIAHVTTMLAFFVFGSVLLGPRIGEVSGEMVLYALLSLTVVRMIPVGIAMVRSDLHVRTRAFLGWFGPRGLASLVFATTVVINSGLPNAEVINLVVLITVGISVLVHGLTAWPGSKSYSAWFDRESARNSDAAEARSVQAMDRHPKASREWTIE
jgi:NhaP-type Na+/H+ or K+/H+ antiporter